MAGWLASPSDMVYWILLISCRPACQLSSLCKTTQLPLTFLPGYVLLADSHEAFTVKFNCSANTFVTSFGDSKTISEMLNPNIVKFIIFFCHLSSKFINQTDS